EALVIEADAMRLAAASLERAPEPRRVLGALAAVDAWTDRARARLEAGSYPALDSAAAEVSAFSASARAALARGDTLAAVGEISRASLRAREQAPLAVGLRLLAAAETRVRGVGKGADADRIRKLIGGAREGLAMGDSIRALRRVLYAVQMLDELAVETVDRRGAPR
ncbi:MAG TPA: hypothetical protein VFQ45_08585, partial [Longimicrobium sp.]|nr:hypothetical protein [Longimicrobium sp.]